MERRRPMFPPEGVRIVSVTPGEVCLHQPRFIVEFAKPVASTPAACGLQVKGFRGRIKRSKGGRQLEWIPDKPLPVGRHSLIIGETLLANGEKVSCAGEIHFSVVRSKARVGTSFKVYGYARRQFKGYSAPGISIHDEAPGRYVEFLKVENKKTGKWTTLAFDSSGKQVAYESLMKRLLAADTRVYGKLQPGLYRALKSAGASTSVPVAILVASEETLSIEEGMRLKNTKERETPPLAKDARAKWVASAEPVARQITDLIKRKVKIDPLAPVIYADLSKKQIGKIQSFQKVIALYHLPKKAFDDLDDSERISNADHAHNLGYEGSGIDVAVWEPGPDNTAELVISGQYDTSAGAATSSHATLTHAVIKNRNTSNASTGYAPSCNLYSANSYDRDALRWAVKDVGCTVISQSFHRDAEQTSDTLSFDDFYKDWLALHWPYPTIVQAAGNGATSTEYVNHKGYNGLVAGSHNDQATAMASDSVFRNPASGHGDRELPEICANGTAVTSCHESMGGTSFAAPAVAGAAAVVQSADTLLKRWPEGCRAILMAAAGRSVKDSTWWKDVYNGTDGADGAGALDVLEAVRITLRRIGRNNEGSLRGWDIGMLAPSDFGTGRQSTFSYFVKIAAPETPSMKLLGPLHVKVALAWNSTTKSFLGIPIASRLGIDLDLHVLDSGGNPVALSQSWDNSYEIVDFEGTPGETYEIKIRWWSGSGRTWYGIAWSVTGGMLIGRVSVKEYGVLRRQLELESS
jgi:hypothetical protein